MKQFVLHAPYKPTGDQPEAIEELIAGLDQGHQHQVLLGATGTGKTFTMANIIEQTQRPTLVIAHNKTLVAQLYAEFKEFFPENAVEYFVSYYDYYQPEAYVPRHDLYIEKETDINEEIERLRLAATTSLMSRKDVHHRRLGLVHLRPGQPGSLRQGGHPPQGRRGHPAQLPAAPTGGDPLRPQRHRPGSRRFPGARRHPGSGPGLPGQDSATASPSWAMRSSASSR